MAGFIVLLCLLFFQGFWQAQSADCSTAKTSSQCSVINGCTWQSSSCLCASAVAMDVAFALDSSGSIGASYFQTELSFVSQIILSGLTTEARVAIIEFATQVQTVLNFTTSALMTTSQISATVLALPYWASCTNTVGAIQAAMTLFALQSSANRAKVLVIVTDGNPACCTSGCSNDVCSYASSLKSSGIEVVIIGVGSSWDEAKVDCLVDSSSDIITVSSFSTSAFNAALPAITSITCPETYNLKVTEVQPVPASLTSGSRFIEIYNEGGSASMYNIELQGLFSGTVTSNQSAQLMQAQYLVVYDVNAGVPNCTDCTSCTSKNSKSQCTNAIYVPCGSNGGGYSCWLTSSSVNKTNWYVKLIDQTDGSVIDLITYSSSSWPSIYTGYSYELKNKGYDETQGGNWQMSCNVRGTPGADPITSCSQTCTADQCQLNGDINATCASNKCDCGTNTGYYSPYGLTCYQVPPPGTCYAYWMKNGSVQLMHYIWDKANSDVDLKYQLTYYDSVAGTIAVYTTARTYDSITYDFNRGVSAIAGYVQTLINGSLSTSSSCTVITSAPTFAPSQSPSRAPSQKPTYAPTPRPTWDTPRIYLGGDLCAMDRCDCYEKSWSCTGSEITKTYVQSSSPQYVTVMKVPTDFPDTVLVYWNITKVGTAPSNSSSSTGSTSRRILQISDTTVSVTTSTTPPANMTSVTDNTISPMSGWVNFNESYEDRIPLLISTSLVESDVSLVYYLQIINCSTTQYCDIVYPSALYMTIQTSSNASTVSVNSKSYTWLWYVIILLVLFLVLLTWLVYRYWWKNKQSKQRLNQVEEQLDDAREQDELGFGHDLGKGNVSFNPLGAGAPTMARPNNTMNDGELSQNQYDSQKADVPVMKFQHREQFGQVPGKGQSKTNLVGKNNLKQPLLGTEDDML